jgi:putative DNA primase/helicase
MASLSITGIEGQVLVYCHAGCQTIDVLAALNLTMRDLFDTRRGAEYRYDNGRTVHRSPDKRFRQANTDRPVELYRLARVREAVASGRPVYVVEGEKDVHALESAGVVATCSPMGAGKWAKVDPSPLHGGQVLIIADQDEPGRKHAADVLASLQAKAAVAIFAPKAGKDAADHIAAGYGVGDFVPMEVPIETPGKSTTSTDPLPGEPWTELGYARRLIAAYGDRLRYVPAWRKWLVWGSARWAIDDTGQAARWCKVIARQLTTDAMAITDADKRAALVRLARRGESSAGVAGALTLASTESEVAVTPDDLDADPFLLNCTNGTLDLRTGELREHDPADLLTKITGAAYRPETLGPEWVKFLTRVQPDEGMREFLARLTGLALEGRVVEHLLPIHHGHGANGKTTFTDAVLHALGDYADVADPDLLTARTFDAHPTGVADLFGLRLAVLHESDAGRRLAEGTVKRLTGGDRVKARRMREDFWSFDPSHTFVMLTNHKPIIGGTDEGIWRRLRLVPWDVVIPPAERDAELGDKLQLEADAVLSWLVNGYREWRGRGLAEPDAVTAATKAFRDESDALGRFLEQRCFTGQHYNAGSSDLFSAWSTWCGQEGEEPGTQTAFATRMQNKGLDNYTLHGRRRWRGVGLAVAVEGEGG